MASFIVNLAAPADPVGERSPFSRADVGFGIESNEQVLSEIAWKRGDFMAKTHDLAQWARTYPYVDRGAAEVFIASVIDALAKLFGGVEREIADDIESDRELLRDDRVKPTDADALDVIGALR